MLRAFQEGSAAAWSGTPQERNPYAEPVLSSAWDHGWSAGQAERAHLPFWPFSRPHWSRPSAVPP
jgi:ribosome modulation factor